MKRKKQSKIGVRIYKPEKEEITIEPRRYALREDDTRVKLFDPQLRTSGWDEENIRRHYYITKGKIFIEGDKSKRGKRKFADYVLFHNNAFPIAVVEAKDENHTSMDGMQLRKEDWGEN